MKTDVTLLTSALDRYCPKCGSISSKSRCPHDGEMTIERGIFNELSSNTPFAGRYQLLSPKSHDPLGLNYRAKDLESGALLDIRIFSKDFTDRDAFENRFERVSSKVKALSHPQIQALLDFGQTGAKAYYWARESVDGPSLREALHERGPFSLEHAITIGQLVLDALIFAHDRAFIHQHLGLHNMFLKPTAHEHEQSIILGDIGLYELAMSLNSTGGGEREKHAKPFLASDLFFMTESEKTRSPEQILGHAVTELSSLYALGASLYELVTGRPVFLESSSQLLLSAHVNEAPPSLLRGQKQQLGPFPDWILKCLEKKPWMRGESLRSARLELKSLQSRPVRKKRVPTEDFGGRILTPKAFEATGDTLTFSHDASEKITLETEPLKTSKVLSKTSARPPQNASFLDASFRQTERELPKAKASSLADARTRLQLAPPVSRQEELSKLIRSPRRPSTFDAHAIIKEIQGQRGLWGLLLGAVILGVLFGSLFYLQSGKGSSPQTSVKKVGLFPQEAMEKAALHKVEGFFSVAAREITREPKSLSHGNKQNINPRTLEALSLSQGASVSQPKGLFGREITASMHGLDEFSNEPSLPDTRPKEKPKTHFSLDTTPSHASIFHEGQWIGRTPFEGSFDSHRPELVLTKTGYKSIRITLEKRESLLHFEKDEILSQAP